MVKFWRYRIGVTALDIPLPLDQGRASRISKWHICAIYKGNAKARLNIADASVLSFSICNINPNLETLLGINI